MASCSTLSLILIALLRASMYIINSVYDFGKTLMSRSTVKVWLIGLAWDDWRIRINDGSCLIENTADGDGILEGRGIERDEGGTTVGETGGGAESELEGLFEEETTKDHEVWIDESGPSRRHCRACAQDRWGHGTAIASATWRAMAGMLTGFLVPGSRETMVNWHVNKTSSGLTVSPSFGALATCNEISMLERPVA
ncbi:hypothetical protein KCV06_g246, partial [Aureobasidium melanogenum]